MQDVEMQDMKLRDIIGVFSEIYCSFILKITVKKFINKTNTIQIQ